MFFRSFFLGWVLTAFGLGFAADPTSYTPKKLLTIPLPRQSEYATQGLQTGMGLGAVERSGCQTRFEWQGATDYSYTPRISGGGAVRLFGGSINSKYSLVYSRMFVESRFHFLIDSTLDLYVGPVLGLDNANFQSIRSMINSPTTVDTASDQYCQEAFDMNGPSISWDAGLGWKINQSVGLTASNSVSVNFQEKFLISFSLGLAYNARPLLDRFTKNLGGVWLHLEWVPSFTIPKTSLENSFVLGFSAVF